MWIAITREVSPALAGCELSFVPRSPIDVALARQQHAAYCRALESAGCDVIELPALPDYPDSVFVEDVALVFDEVAIATHPGAESRRGEGQAVHELLRSLRPLRYIQAPGTLDGGDVLCLGKRVFVGISARSNEAGRAQLRDLLAPYGYTVEGVATRECLHLKSAVTRIAGDTLLMNRMWLADASPFAGYRILDVDPDEEHAANAVCIGEVLVYPECFPKTRARLEAAGLRVIPVDVSELQKAEGAATCCSLLLRTEAGA